MKLKSNDPLDCLIIGGGAGGLTAAIYLSRFRRQIRLVDAGESRARWIAKSHNYPGFVEGISGPEFLRNLAAQVRQYDAPCTRGTVELLAKQPDGTFMASIGAETIHAKTVLLSTGVRDLAPDVEGIDDAIHHGSLRYCPVCDGFEAIDKKVAVLGNGAHGVQEAMFIKGFASDLTLITDGEVIDAMTTLGAELEAHSIKVLTKRLAALTFESGGISARLEDGGSQHFDILYSALGVEVRSHLALGLGAACDRDQNVAVDPHMETSVAGLYAVGDVTVGLNQISVATGQAAIAATAIHNVLRRR